MKNGLIKKSLDVINNTTTICVLKEFFIIHLPYGQ